MEEAAARKKATAFVAELDHDELALRPGQIGIGM